jgi:hypothetical protein
VVELVFGELAKVSEKQSDFKGTLKRISINSTSAFALAFAFKL